MANPLGSAPGIIVGVGVGTAAAAALEPAIELPRQAAWRANPVRLLDPAVMGRLVASGGVDLGTAQADAKGEGYGEDKLNALVYLAQTVPGFAEAITALRRKTITPDDFAHTLVKTALDARYYPAIEDLENVWLTPAQIALGIIRGLIPDPGLLAVDLPTAGSNVPTYPASTIDALKEALGGGINTDRLRVLVGTIGLPPSVQQLASMVFRGIVTEGAYNQGVLEGDARPEWAPYWLEQARQILTAGEYAELELRGYYDRPTRLANTAKHGMSDADSDLLFEVQGRGLSLHQMVIGQARGGVYNGPIDQIPAPELASMQRGNLRPEYYNIAYAGRYGYPTGFQIKAEAKDGTLNQADTKQILLELGWDPKWATLFSTAWTGSGGTTAAQKKQTLSHLTDEYLSGALSRAGLTTALTALGYTAQQATDEINLAEFNASKTVRTKATTAIGKRYIALQLTQAEAEADMAALGWPQGAIDKYVAGWNAERDDEGTTLTQAQVLKAYNKGTLSQADALARLTVLGLNASDAQVILGANAPAA